MDLPVFTRESKKFIQIGELNLAYVEVGEGPPIVFQHGNPTSSYLWRNVMPQLQDHGRCIALDLIGMGDSDKLPNSGPNSYTFVEHARYFDAALEILGVTEDAVFVIHDWGSALGFNWFHQHPVSVKGICYMEAIVRPLTWDEFPNDARSIFEGFRSPAGDAMTLERNLFVERVLPGSMLQKLDPSDMEEYRRPFLEPGEGRRPTLTWPRQIPIDDQPTDVCEIVSEYAERLSSSNVPKLFINAEPGAILIGAQREFCRQWPNQTEVSVRASHFVPEDDPDGIARILNDWLETL